MGLGIQLTYEAAGPVVALGYFPQPPPEKHDETGNCVVMRDPEGNEFCVHRAS